MDARHLASIHDLSIDDLNEILSLSIAMKRFPLRYRASLRAMTLAMVFQKPSTRTRVSFQVGIHQLGGLGLVLGERGSSASFRFAALPVGTEGAKDEGSGGGTPYHLASTFSGAWR